MKQTKTNNMQNHKARNWYFEKINDIDKPVDRPVTKNRTNYQYQE